MASPKLRFKEFDGDWNSIAIGKFLKIKSGLGFKAEEYSTEQEIRLLQIENVGYGAVKWTHNVKFVPTNYLDVHKDLVLKEGDLVLALNRPVTNDQLKIAKLTQEDSPSILYQRVGKLDFLKEDIDKEFIFQIFKKDVKNYVLNSSIGSDQPFISTTDLYKHKLCIPLKEEQTKIASFLSAVDEKISQLTQKHTLLSQYKQGMMQKLFSQQIRFKADDGSEFGEWEDKILKDLFPKIRNGFVGVATPYYVNYGVKYLQGKNIKNGKIDATGLIFINQEFHQKKTNSILKTNDILMVQSGHVGECAVVTEDYDNANCHALLVLSPKSSKLINSKFVVYYFYSEIGKKKIALIKTGNTIEHILASDIKEVALLFPCLAEQSKIANFLSAIDQKIEVVAQQIEQAKTWKKGLLQQMFV
ncbi:MULTISPECIES: restriction endonuclease subunit S [Acinetobacter]|uniref:restriction endonuclease subunit S n=1 Tax=Acinetobacter TaxID=469 RepID=UPI0002CD9CC4|nr:MULTISPECIES: restriction endonuclease subunit S [Acinetobacter]ENU62900.1 hypothetical protein F980_01408 [Acinetobacter lwoffii NIPH 715]